MVKIQIPFGLGLKVITPRAKIESELARACATQMNARMKGVDIQVRELVEEKLEEIIRGSSTYDALMNGQLRTELGLADPAGAMDQIIQAVKAGVKITRTRFTVRARSFSGGFKIVALPSSYVDLISLDLASYVSENGHQVPWLRWLLLEGRAPVVMEHRIQFNRPRKSRTDDAIMHFYGSGAWAVPAEHAGDAEQNFITEGLDTLKDPISGVIMKGLSG